MNELRYSVTPRYIMRHPDGRTASLTGAVPGPGFVCVTVGWTLYDSWANTYGAASLGPNATLEQALALADKLNAP